MSKETSDNPSSFSTDKILAFGLVVVSILAGTAVIAAIVALTVGGGGEMAVSVETEPVSVAVTGK